MLTIVTLEINSLSIWFLSLLRMIDKKYLKNKKKREDGDFI